MRKLSVIASMFVLFACGNQNETINASIVKNNYSALEEFEKQQGGASILFNEMEYEFPAAEKGTDLEHSFYFVNNGDAPLILTNVKGSCGCTNVDYPEDPINPGDKGVITAEVNNSGKAVGKKFRVRVTVESNAQNAKLKLVLSGMTLEKK